MKHQRASAGAAPRSVANSALQVGSQFKPVDNVSEVLCRTTVVAWRLSESLDRLSRIDHARETIETAIFCLAIFWTPSLALMGYLLLPRPGD
jgi:hypothetical protein